MKRILLLLLFLIASAAISHAQGIAYTLNFGTNAQKPGTCGAGDVYVATDTGHLWICPVSTFVDFGAGGGTGANTALSNLAAVSINTALLAQTGVDLGSTTKPFRNAFIFGAGTYSTTYIELTGTPTSTDVATIPDNTGTVAELNLAQSWTALQSLQIQSAGGQMLALNNTTTTADKLDLGTFGLNAHNGLGFVGFNLFINSSAVATRDDSSGAAWALILDNQEGSVDKFYTRHISQGGTSIFPSSLSVTGSQEVLSGGAYTFSSSSTDAALTGPDTYIRRNNAANIAFGTTDAASPVAQILSVQNVVGGTSNVAGTETDIIGSLATGNARNGAISLQRGALAASGTTQQTAIHGWVMAPSKVLTNNSAISIINVTDASNTAPSVIFHYGIEVFDGTNLQVEEGEVSCHVINKAGAFSSNACTKFGNQQALGSGTLTVTAAISAANPAVITVNANSSLTPSTGYPRISFMVFNGGQQALSFP